MIARENLESRKQKLENHIGTLGLEKLSCIERIDQIDAEMGQSVVLLKVFEATLVDLEKDERGVDGAIDSLEGRVEELENQIMAYKAANEGNNDAGGGSESN